jgi:DNA (cytosine-5)-methyltransferase 1
MNYLSVCSGIEAATVAWHDMGWNPVGFSEIEKFPSQLLAHHYPNVTNYGDMTKFKEWNINEPVNLLVGGTPCQSFSVAGLRKGLDDPRGNLMLTYLAMADHFKPKWLLWENVPGVLSSNRGSDFAALLQGMAQLGYGFAYRVLDAQHFGVPQRRRRVFVVGCLGDWRSAAKVLFESESLCRDITPRRGEGKDLVKCITTRVRNDYETESFVTVYETHPADSRVKEMGDVCQTVTTRWGTGGGNVPIAFTTEQTPKSSINLAHTLTSSNHKHNQCIALAENTIGRQPQNGGNGDGFTEGGPMYTLNATGVHGIAHAFKVRGGCEGGGKGYLGNDNIAFTLSTTQDQQLFNNMRVRRITPMECERLQGFPDNYTNTPTSSDSTRYKALGNSMAVPVMKWIGNRIMEIDDEQEQL